jgi:hypothetical protein
MAVTFTKGGVMVAKGAWLAIALSATLVEGLPDGKGVWLGMLLDVGGKGFLLVIVLDDGGKETLLAKVLGVGPADAESCVCVTGSIIGPWLNSTLEYTVTETEILRAFLPDNTKLQS